MIDVKFDFRTDTPKGKDPDTWSPSLCAHHKFLWSKELPSGGVFELNSENSAPFYLRHKSHLGDFCLSSDTVVPTFKRQKLLTKIFEEDPPDLRNFGGLGYTIGGMMIYPANQIDGKWTINQARGCTGQIRDRFDYTVECVRRYYRGEKSPLSDVFSRYADFFELFEDFAGYVKFFLLQDIVSTDFSSVRFFTPFDDFQSTLPIPRSKDDYIDYKSRAIDFLNARNDRIQKWTLQNIEA